jgi:pheromone shutdown-related protein TraB
MSEIPELPQNVDCIELGDRKIFLVGTAHISHKSADLAEEMIRSLKPDSVAVELCESRYDSMQDPDRWRNTDIITVIRQGRAYVLMAQLVLAGFQKKLGNKLNIRPGEEMLRAIQVTKDVGATTVLADRNVRVTLKRVWSALGFISVIKVLGAMIGGLFSSQEITEDEIERLKTADALEELMKEFSEALPEVRRALIDERDQYLAQKIKQAPGNRVVAIMGAGHIPGIKKWIHEEVDVAALETIPPPSIITKLIGWLFPAIFVGLIIWGFFSGGGDKSVDMMWTWVWVNGLAAGIGSAVCLAHPFTILSAAAAAPFTSLHPLLASGWIAAIVEAWIHKPTVADLEHIADDVSSLKGIYSNRVSRVLLVMGITNLFGTVGAILGVGKLVTISQQ